LPTQANGLWGDSGGDSGGLLGVVERLGGLIQRALEALNQVWGVLNGAISRLGLWVWIITVAVGTIFPGVGNAIGGGLASTIGSVLAISSISQQSVELLLRVVRLAQYFEKVISGEMQPQQDQGEQEQEQATDQAGPDMEEMEDEAEGGEEMTGEEEGMEAEAPAEGEEHGSEVDSGDTGAEDEGESEGTDEEGGAEAELAEPAEPAEEEGEGAGMPVAVQRGVAPKAPAGGAAPGTQDVDTGGAAGEQEGNAPDNGPNPQELIAGILDNVMNLAITGIGALLGGIAVSFARRVSGALKTLPSKPLPKAKAKPKGTGARDTHIREPQGAKPKFDERNFLKQQRGASTYSYAKARKPLSKRKGTAKRLGRNTVLTNLKKQADKVRDKAWKLRSSKQLKRAVANAKKLLKDAKDKNLKATKASRIITDVDQLLSDKYMHKLDLMHPKGIFEQVKSLMLEANKVESQVPARAKPGEGRKKKKIKNAIRVARKHAATTLDLAQKARKNAEDAKALAMAKATIPPLLDHAFFAGTGISPTYIEGDVREFRDFNNQTTNSGDQLTGHHVLADKYVTNYTWICVGGTLRRPTRLEVYAINMEAPIGGDRSKAKYANKVTTYKGIGRHQRTRTHTPQCCPGGNPKNPPAKELEEDLDDIEMIYKADGLWSTYIQRKLQELKKKIEDQLRDSKGAKLFSGQGKTLAGDQLSDTAIPKSKWATTCT
jgi:hypothetical protein